LPFVLMFCGGCVATAPAASILVVALAGLMWFGDAVMEATTTTSHWVVYRKQPLWKVGETKEDATARRSEEQPVELEDSVRYPEDYSGRIQGVFSYKDARPSWAVDSFGCEMFQLTDVQRQTCWQRAVKVVGGTLIPVTFEDKFGATAGDLRASYTDAEVLAAKKNNDPLSIEIAAKTLSLSKSLAKTITHTGTGLYAVKVTPTNESEVQLGAVVGQVVTIVGTVAASPAFTGGYISNTTRSQVRAIVSHTANTATLEGDISAWVDTDTLEWYDSWSTVDAAGEQLLVDQGVTQYAATQEIRTYAGTYTEAINVGTMTPTSQFRWKFTVNGSDSVTLSNNGLAADLMEFNDSENVEFYDVTLNCDNNDMVDGAGRGPFWFYDCAMQGGNGGLTSDVACYDCTFTSQNYAFRFASSPTYERCTFTSCTDAISQNVAAVDFRVSACIFDSCTDCISVNRAQATFVGAKYCAIFTNNTAYNCTNFLNFENGASNGLMVKAHNNIFHTVGTVWYCAGGSASSLTAIECDHNTYYNVTQIAYVGGSNHTLVQWQALSDTYGTSPDANSVETDPGLTNPAGADFSLSASSDCRHAGVGSYAVCPTGVNGVAFDKWHPDKGAWSSGVGPNRSWGG